MPIPTGRYPLKPQGAHKTGLVIWMCGSIRGSPDRKSVSRWKIIPRYLPLVQY